jgi:hypothetical protein
MPKATFNENTRLVQLILKKSLQNKIAHKKTEYITVTKSTIDALPPVDRKSIKRDDARIIVLRHKIPLDTDAADQILGEVPEAGDTFIDNLPTSEKNYVVNYNKTLLACAGHNNVVVSVN